MRVGQHCSFYHEGGVGERHWVRGWRYGVIRQMPVKGKHKHHTQVEVTRGYKAGTERTWVPRGNVNEPWDTKYHGLRLDEMVAERKTKKATDQAAADKKVKRLTPRRPKPR